MSSIDDFFSDPTELEETVQREKDEEKKTVVEPAKQSGEEESKEFKDLWEASTFELGQDIENVFLLDALYDGQSNKAELIFYHPDTRSLYRWRDTTGHQPYLYTTMSKDEIERIPEVVNNRRFVRIDEVEKVDPYTHKPMIVRKVFGQTPLEIGGDNMSFRNYINPSYEADIRYHLNFMADNGISPATYYSIRGGELIPTVQLIEKETEEELHREFADEKKEELDMLEASARHYRENARRFARELDPFD